MTQKLTLRLPDALHADLREIAFRNRTSLNQEILKRLEAYIVLMLKIKSFEGKIKGHSKKYL